MDDLPAGVFIETGALRFGNQNIFLRNVTSTKIEVADSFRSLTGKGVGALFGGIALGLILFSWKREWFYLIGAVSVGVVAAMLNCKQETIYRLVVVTSAGEIEVLLSQDRQALDKITAAISAAIAEL